MKILFYAAKSFDRESFDAVVSGYPDVEIDYISHELEPGSAKLAEGYDASVLSLVQTSAPELLVFLQNTT